MVGIACVDGSCPALALQAEGGIEAHHYSRHIVVGIAIGDVPLSVPT